MNMTPMIDVVFLLIIFFLVSSHLAQQETQLELTLPQATTGDDTPAPTRPRMTLNVFASGDVLLGSEPVGHEEILKRLKYEQEASGEGIEVRIRCDAQTTYATVTPLLLACAQAGVWDVSFSVRNGGRNSP